MTEPRGERPRGPITASPLAWTLWALTAAMTSVGLVLVGAGATSWRRFLAVGHPDSVVVALAGGFFGAVIVGYHRRNPVGWLLVANAVGHGARTLAAEYAAFALVRHHGSLPAGGVASWLARPPLIVAGPLLAFVLLRFPDGELLSKHWRAVEVGLSGVVAVAVVAVGALSWPLRGPSLLDGGAVPATSRGRSFTHLDHAGQGLVALGLILATVSLVLRYRRSSGLVRQQLKWIAFGAVPTVGLLIASHPVGGVPGGWLAMASPAPLLVSIVVAIRRHRLYDIDRIISRTVAYAGLTAILTGAFFAISTLVAAMFGLAGSDSPPAVAAAAVAVTAMFQPLRRRLQDLCDRRFRRRSYEATRVIAGYLDSLHAKEPDVGTLAATLRRALGDPSAEVGFWLGEHTYVGEDGEAIELPNSGDRIVHRVDRGSEHLGVVVVDPRILDEQTDDAVGATVAAATPAFDHGRLRAQTRVQLAEVRASRARIVAAADQARRRVERDLHDGAQQRIVALGLDLARLRSRAETAHHPELVDGLTSAKGQLDEALSELRELARGLHPTLLTEQGVAAAVESLAERCPVPVEVTVDTGGRRAAQVEATAYFVVAEALANVAKYAGATKAVVRVTATGDVLHVEVGDDGVGGARPAAGSGLSGLSDRVAALGGELTVDSPAHCGTRLIATLPL